MKSIKLIDEIYQKLQKAINFLQQKYLIKFKEQMLSLYQNESVFYEVINKSLMKFTEKDFPWQSLALPFCLLYKAIKLDFHEAQNVDKIFGNKN